MDRLIDLLPQLWEATLETLYVATAALILGGLGGLVLAMTRADWFWIGNAIFAGFVLSAILGGIARLVAYRRGFQ